MYFISGYLKNLDKDTILDVGCYFLVIFAFEKKKFGTIMVVQFVLRRIGFR